MVNDRSWFNFGWSLHESELVRTWSERKGKDIPVILEEDPHYIPVMEESIFVNNIDPKDVVIKNNGIVEFKNSKKKNRKHVSKSLREELIIIRGSNKCEICNETKYHHIHHVDGDPSNNEVENLLLVCIDCHKVVHGNVT